MVYNFRFDKKKFKSNVAYPISRFVRDLSL